MASTTRFAVDHVLRVPIHQWVQQNVLFALRAKRIQLPGQPFALLAPKICSVRMEPRLALPLAPLDTSTL